MSRLRTRTPSGGHGPGSGRGSGVLSPSPRWGLRLVVVGGVGPKHLLQVPAAEHEYPVQALGPDRADPPLGVGVRSRSPDGVLMILTPSERNTSSNGPENFESRSRISEPDP